MFWICMKNFSFSRRSLHCFLKKCFWGGGGCRKKRFRQPSFWGKDCPHHSFFAPIILSCCAVSPLLCFDCNGSLSDPMQMFCLAIFFGYHFWVCRCSPSTPTTGTRCVNSWIAFTTYWVALSIDSLVLNGIYQMPCMDVYLIEVLLAVHFLCYQSPPPLSL